MLIVIDNYDSFTYNLVQYLWELGAELQVIRNDQWTVDEVLATSPQHVLISPGPCTPDEAGISVALIQACGQARIPTLGVCLGHQSLGQAFGAVVGRASRLMHGKTSLMRHDGQGVFCGLPETFTATRYHSLIVEQPLPECLQATAWTVDQEELMGIRHRHFPLAGVQFHPESFLTEHGHQLLRNFLEGSL
ncbi:MAG: aminodeoxychorismate/anthranilate synthase component II [Planctomycetota bacterium]|nr:MAG: aminodeoxychorismate/anthranilate synthase component II [Planctomycetota bacterium]